MTNLVTGSDAAPVSRPRLNLGCGGDILRGWVNVDKFPGPGVDLVMDLEESPWPWDTGSIDEVRSFRLFNHMLLWEPALLECARVLRRGGTLDVNVHYGIDPVLFIPYHLRVFDEHTFDGFCDNLMGKTSVPFVKVKITETTTSTLERSTPYFSRVEFARLREGYPFVWHLARKFGERVYRWPLGRCTSLRFIFKRNDRDWSPRTG